ncbi:MAG: hypothetical protein S4CHLAM81_03200 [Chlamydiales bacterium]|nr:hypothetical protein [Chlamydiales bacterium]MCH9635110.1 hypothetical protein [Chlamydiales bacterium]MCH9703826.1 SpoIIE family protein phosphatase [Chlamydiota bacterium]
MSKTRFIIRFLALNFFLLALPLLIATTISLAQFYKMTVERGRQDMAQVAHLRTLILREWLPPNLPTAQEILFFNDVGKREINFNDLSKKLKGYVKEHSDYLFLFLDSEADKDNNHKIVAASDAEFVKSSMGNFYLNPIINEDGQGLIMRYLDINKEKPGSHPYLLGLLAYDNEEGKREGWIVEAVDMSFPLEEVLSTTYFSYLSFALVNDANIMLAASDSKLSGNFFTPLSEVQRRAWARSGDLEAVQLAEKQLQSTPFENGFFEFQWDGQTQMAYREQIPASTLSVMVYTPKATFIMRALDQYTTLYIVYVAILIIATLIVIILGIWIGRPFTQLSSLMEEVSEGNLDVRFEPQTLGYEMNILGGIFNSTLQSMKQNIEQAENERISREKYQRELSLGRQVQKSLLPEQLPVEPQIEFKGLYIQSQKVSGDFYLVEKHKRGYLVALFDVGGRGISSSLYALSVRSLLRSYATFVDDVGELMNRVSSDFALEGDIEASAFVALIDLDAKVLEYCSCGHLPAFLKKRGSLLELDSASWKLGEKSEERYESRKTEFKEGDQLFIYTDGLTEARNEQEVAIEVSGVKKHIASDPLASIDSLKKLWEEHSSKKIPEDEILILTCQIKS